MPLRTRLLLAFVAVHLALAIGVGLAAWQWVDEALRAQAESSARAVGRVLTQGGFSPTPAVLDRMRELTGYEFAVLAGPAPPAPGTVQVAAGGLTIAIAYRTPVYAQVRQEIAVITALVVVVGSGAFAAVAVLLARRFSRPVERLAAAARTIGGGDWTTPVAVDRAGRELDQLAGELEAMRVRLRDLDAANRRAERLATLGTFTATIAHEVRNPLSAVRLAAQMLGRSGSQIDRDAAGLIHDEIERLDLVVDELLGFARGMTVNLADCDLRPVADAICGLLARQAGHAGVAITVDGGGKARADPRRLRQLALNLVLNAIQAIQGSGIGSQVTIRIGDGRLAVEDDGPGIDPAVLPRLFDAFASGRPEGTGLGLHLARAIAEAHGARLAHQRTAGRTVFTVAGLVPVRPVDETASAQR
ncbi:hypothetical protein LBMAG53_00590 [Planctomycetota bacterium]|nr:hypothetical protein LBMAG53_00590 [Planctomycetota bacterium]